MSVRPPPAQFDYTRIPPSMRREFVAALEPAERAAASYCWPLWARADQLPPPGNWRTWLNLAGRGAGKALDVATQIPTPTGWARLGDLKPGDYVLDENGAPTAIIAVYEPKARCAIRLEFSDGEELVCCDEHQWNTWTARDRRALARNQTDTLATNRVATPPDWPAWRSPRGLGPRVRTTTEIVTTLRTSDGTPEHSIPRAGALRLPWREDLQIDPYVLGYWLSAGDPRGEKVLPGARRKTSLESLARLRRSTGSGAGDKPAPRPMLPLTARLEALGLIGERRIPMDYRRAAAPQRAELLRGLLDGAQSIGTYGERNGRADYFAPSRVLADHVAELARTVGYIAGVAATTGGARRRWRVSWDTLRGDRGPHRYIVRARPVLAVPKMRCLTVDSPSALFLAGAGLIPTHNTRSGSEWIRQIVEKEGVSRIALIGATAADVRDTMVLGESGILACCPPWNRPTYEPSKRRVIWPNGAQALAYSAEEPDRLRGSQAEAGWCDELAAWKNPRDTWDQFSFTLRLGANPRVYVSTTPRPLPIIRELVRDPSTVTTRGSTLANAANLAPQFLAEIKKRYAGTRLGRQEMLGEILEDVENGLWTWASFDGIRAEYPQGGFKRIVIGVDPSGGGGDSQGIVAAGLGADGLFYVLEDGSCKLSPERWASRVVDLFDRWRADKVVFEKNYGGDMGLAVLRQARRGLPVRMVSATRGKHVRAEPIALLYEQGRVRHLAPFPELEAECVSMTPTGYVGEGSPDRLDALVWAMTELSGGAGHAVLVGGGV